MAKHTYLRAHWEIDIPKGRIFLLQLTSRTSAEGVLKAEKSRTGLLPRWKLTAAKSGIVHSRTFRSEQFGPDPGLGKFMREKRTVAIFQLSELIRGQCYLKKINFNLALRAIIHQKKKSSEASY